MITTKKALAVILANVRPLQATRTSLDSALGRCLAEEILADRDAPPTDRSAMDGFAVRAKDLAKCPRALSLIGEVEADGPAHEGAQGDRERGVITSPVDSPRFGHIALCLARAEIEPGTRLALEASAEQIVEIVELPFDPTPPMDPA